MYIELMGCAEWTLTLKKKGDFCSLSMRSVLSCFRFSRLSSSGTWGQSVVGRSFETQYTDCTLMLPKAGLSWCASPAAVLFQLTLSSASDSSAGTRRHIKAGAALHVVDPYSLLPALRCIYQWLYNKGCWMHLWRMDTTYDILQVQWIFTE